ncbi:MAG: hypothetical protein AVDCRST_MAG77-2676 [uncultured Chloroflexi bacterium]|uniref:Uncharacterized protein n=1 Tax=uncultured Chloroflexota bacterium TaxID=166587 RepID=A0A6J4IT25_9CHLR|nr:MAG: hypothetical protein AVDCRST_MAG77-2676 [uncultured Chloroflexota bacterium]
MGFETADVLGFALLVAGVLAAGMLIGLAAHAADRLGLRR